MVLRTDTVRMIDTVLEVRIDTHYQRETVYLDRLVPVKADTFYIYKTDTINTYVGVSEDSTIRINYKAEVLGSFKGLQLDYVLKAPRLIEKTITQTIRDSTVITNTAYRSGFYLGSGFRYSPFAASLQLSIDAGYQNRKGWFFGYRYEPTTKTHGATIAKRIF